MTQELAEAMPGRENGRKTLLVVEHLKKYFSVGGGFLRRSALLRAVDDVSFEIFEGETFGLVGESGCGKSTLALTVVRLYEPDGGRIVFDGTDISHLSAAKLRPFRKDIQMIFQDPYSSLDPRMTVGGIIEEPLRNFGVPNRRERVRELLQAVGLNAYFVNRYPHEFSGGQRQRISIARAMALEPSFVVLDEPTSALDMIVQAQIVDLLRALQKKRDLTFMFISHDLRVVSALASRILVMRNGKMVEEGPAHDVFEHPKEDYTRALFAAAFNLDATGHGVVRQ